MGPAAVHGFEHFRQAVIVTLSSTSISTRQPPRASGPCGIAINFNDGVELASRRFSARRK
jgi:hypothetical protein